MLRKTLWSAALCAWLLLPAAAASQEMPPGKWWQIPKVARQLELAHHEREKLDELFFDSRHRLIGLKSEVEKHQFELDYLFDNQPLDEGALKAQFRKLESARGALSDERFRFLVEVRKLLGYERFRRLKMLFQEFQERRQRRVP